MKLPTFTGEVSAVADEYTTELNHVINYNETVVLLTTTHYHTQLLREAVETP